MDEEQFFQSRLTTLENAVSGLQEALKVHAEEFNSVVGDIIRCGHVQKFEYCSKLLWKTIKLWLINQEVIDVNSPKAVIKAFYHVCRISDRLYQNLLLAIHHRNLYSHVYSQEEFMELYRELPNHLSTMLAAISLLRGADG
jgi:nucleotidyltransferase substrate binding protein (TIGR01987 family)